ncbi:hypothetical protein OIU76_027767 [Salix suchowensis]|nr:hypothetical protein OIU76_027767 [Salix suchowensis]
MALLSPLLFFSLASLSATTHPSPATPSATSSRYGLAPLLLRVPLPHQIAATTNHPPSSSPSPAFDDSLDHAPMTNPSPANRLATTPASTVAQLSPIEEHKMSRGPPRSYI